ncbi:grhN [Nocardia salmonicida]|uniref:grhN n=1 Tax=Nocardia salmonicida TaxID=53431 RepID=UPI0033C7B62A
MTNSETTNVRLSPPPPELMRLINPVVRRVLATRWLGNRIRRQGMVDITGRRTGRSLRIPVCLHRVGDETLIFTERPWRHNLVGGAPVTVTHRGHIRHGRAVLVDAAPSRVGAAMRAAMDDGARPFELGLKVTRGYDPTADDLAVIARSIIRIDFED